MNCCSSHARSAGRCFSRFARSYRRRFTRKGFEPCQQQLLSGLQQAGYQQASLLEIGSGVGQLHLHLLEQGAASAVGVDLAEAMIAEARSWAQSRGLTARATYHVGDFMELQELPAADITFMDKVVCCYPDADGLVHRSLRHTRRVYGLTYPRQTWYTRLGVLLGGVLMKLVFSDFRPYLHDPRQVERWIQAAGFVKSYENRTLIWLTQVYQRSDLAPPSAA